MDESMPVGGGSRQLLERAGRAQRRRRFGSGKHQHMIKGNIQLTMPNPHRRKDIGLKLLKLLLDEAGISRDEWLKGG